MRHVLRWIRLCEIYEVIRRPQVVDRRAVGAGWD